MKQPHHSEEPQPPHQPVPPPVPSLAQPPHAVSPAEAAITSFGDRLGRFCLDLVKRAVRIIVTWNVVVACLIGTFVVLGIFFAILGSAFGGGDSANGTSGGYRHIYGTGYNQLLSIKISGTIVGSDDSGSLPGIFGGEDQTAGYSVKDQLHAAADDGRIKGVILEIDSPGGTIYGAHAIADGVKYYRDKTHQPVYAHIEGTGASGAYWAAASADKIYADYGSATGSIGVIMGPFEYYNKPLATDGGLLGGGVVTQNGIESVTLTAGTSKDVGNPYRRLTDAEISALQKTVNNEYDTFVSYVSGRRGISQDVIRNQIGAMVYDPKTAQELHLTDATGSRQDAYDALAVAAKYHDDYQVVRQERQSGLVESLLGAVTGRHEATASTDAKPVDLCTLTQTSLAYHGDVSAWCNKR